MFNCLVSFQLEALYTQKGGVGGWDCLDLLMLGWPWYRISRGLYLQAA